jgi:hypothetical protein
MDDRSIRYDLPLFVEKRIYFVCQCLVLTVGDACVRLVVVLEEAEEQEEEEGVSQYQTT